MFRCCCFRITQTHTRGGKGSSRGHKQKKTHKHTHTLAGCPTRALPERNLPAPPTRIFPSQRPETVCPHNRVRRRTSHRTALMLLLLASRNNVPPGRRCYAPQRNLLRQNQTKTKLSNLTRGGAPGQSCGTTFRLQAANRRRNHGGFVDEKRRWHGGGDDDGFKHGIFSILKVRNHGYGRSRGQSETRALKAWRNTERIVQLSFSTGQIYDFAICLPFFFLRDDGSVLVDSVELFFQLSLIHI